MARRTSSSARAICAASAVAMLLASCSRRPGVHVNTAEVTNGPIVRGVLTTGTLTPAKLVDVGSQVSGTVQALDADFNSRVRAGQVIARLDPSSFDAEVTRALAALAESQGNVVRLRVVLEDARAKLARAEALAADDLITRNDLETARLTAAQAASDLKGQMAAETAARALLQQARVNRAHTIIRAPIDGVVVNRLVEVGQTVAASVEAPVLFTIADLRQMQLLAEVNETEIGGIQQGAHASFEIESIGGRQFQGTISQVRLQPVVEQPAATTGTSSSTAGTSSAARGTTPATTGSAPATTGSTTGTSSANASRSTIPTSSTSASTQGTSQSPSPAPPSGGVVSYTAVIDVDNADGALTPGSTAVVSFAGSRRDRAIRIPNNAIAFRPSTDLLAALDQEEPPLDEAERGPNNAPGRPARVWKYEGDKLVAIRVRVGLADDAWTELLAGDLRPGDRLVTSATLGGR